MTETGREEIVWRPTREYAERTRLARFIRSLGVGSLEELQRRSIAEPDWYWDTVVRDLGLRFSRPYTRVRDVSRGVQWPRWFEGGLMNFADNCVDRHIDSGRGDQAALIWEGDDGRTRTLSYHELAREVNHRFGQKTRKTDEVEGDLAMEMADILFVLICMANREGINLQTAFDRMMEKVERRDAERWTRKP